MLSLRKVQSLRLLALKNDWCSANELAEWIGISSKTILSDLNQLASELPYGWELQFERGKGIRLLRSHQNTIRELEYIALRQEDSIKVLLQLLMHPNGLTIRDISFDMFYNVATVQKLLSTIDAFLKPYHLTLKRKPVRITGNEKSIRRLMFDMSLYSKRSPFWDGKHYHTLSNMLAQIEEHYQIQFSDESKKNLICALNIWIFRLSNQNNYQPNNIRIKKAFELAKELTAPIIKIFQPLERICHISIPDEEYFTILLLIAGAPKNGTYPDSIYHLFHTHLSDIAVRRFVEHLEMSFDIQLSTDPIFLECLHQYLNAANFRWRTEINIHRNSFAQEIKFKYKKLFQVVHTYLAEHFPYSHALLDDDIADIVLLVVGSLETQKVNDCLHIGLLASFGDPVALYSKSKLVSCLKTIPTKVTFLEESELQAPEDSPYDIVITTDPGRSRQDSLRYMNPMGTEEYMRPLLEEAAEIWKQKTLKYNLYGARRF